MAVVDRITVDAEPEVKKMLLTICHYHDRNMRQMVSYLIKQEYKRINEKEALK